jgi:branched-subunit amino acid ABC-type transport system permease component
VILGGTGSLTGSAAGGTMVGAGDSFASKLLASSTLQQAAVSLGVDPDTWERIVGQNSESMAQVFVLLLVIGFILIRPSGLFAPRERSYD